MNTIFELDGQTYNLPLRLESVSGMNPSNNKPNIGEAKALIVYANQIEEGYKSEFNILSGQVEEHKRLLEAQGLEVFVGGRAFWHDGTEDPDMVKILTREKKR
jgi:hypothetical protein|tara:strand:- start:940 stop:1248 length:309 start_codon:yes stop_codon:yes gene_type:complete